MSTALTLETPEIRNDKSIQEVMTKLAQYEEKAKVFKVTDQPSAERGVNDAVIIKKMDTYLETRRKEMVAPLNQQVKQINGDFKLISNQLGDISYLFTDRVFKWKAEEKRKADEAQREYERKKREAEEAARKEEERRRKEAEAKHAQEVAKAEKAGEEAPPPPIVAPVEAEEVIEPVIAPPPSTIRSMAGSLGTRTNWKAKVTDLNALVKAIAEGKAPTDCIEPSMTFLNMKARKSDDKKSPYPGVEFIGEETGVIR